MTRPNTSPLGPCIVCGTMCHLGVHKRFLCSNKCRNDFATGVGKRGLEATPSPVFAGKANKLPSLKALRLRRGYATERDLAKRLGVVPETVSEWEAYNKDPSALFRLPYATALGVPLATLAVIVWTGRAAKDAIEAAKARRKASPCPSSSSSTSGSSLPSPSLSLSPESQGIDHAA